MKKKTKERIQLFFRSTGFAAFGMVIGKMHELDIDRITVGQAIVQFAIAFLYLLIAFAAYHAIGNTYDN